MSLMRLGLRLGACEALLEDPVLKPILEGRVYDSDIGSLTAERPVPLVLVSTDEDKGDGFSENNGGPPFDNACWLSLRIAIYATVDEGGDQGLYVPTMTRQMQALLDLIEERCTEAVLLGEGQAARYLRKHIIRRCTDRDSLPFEDDETGLRYAMRAVRLLMHIKTVEPAPALAALSALPNLSASTVTTLNEIALALVPLTGDPPPAFTGADMVIGLRPDMPPVPSQSDVQNDGTAISIQTQQDTVP